MQQILQAAVLADKWQVPNVSATAAQLLADAVGAAGLSEAVKQRVLSAQALPDCLHPLLKSLLLSMFADLEAVWANAELQKQLLALSLPSMEVLLSCDELKVATEDTVLYTLQRYLSSLSTAQQLHARQQLAPLVRCQHLSLFWLTASIMSDEADTMPLADLRLYVKKLALLRSAKPTQVLDWSTLVRDCTRALEGAPDSWQLGQRCHKPVNRVSVTWRVDVSQMRELAQRALRVDRADGQVLVSPMMTAPLGGVTFSPLIECLAVDDGVEVGVFVKANSVPDDACCAYKFKLEAAGARLSCREDYCPEHPGSTDWGSGDFFRMGPMAGGWDEAKWVAKGLPASGELPITLTVFDVAHTSHVPAAVLSTL